MMWSSPWLTSTTICTRGHHFLEFLDPRLLQPGFQKIFEEFVAQKIEPVAALAAQHGVKHARGEHSIRGKKQRVSPKRKPPIAPRRIQRPRKLCEFQVKNPTGRTAVRFSRLPSTRQKIGSPAGDT